MATKTTSRRRLSAKVSKPEGNLKPESRSLLAIKAREAFNHLVSAGVLDQNEDFKAWRHAQVMEAVGLPGISACNGIHFRTVMGHFLTLAGQDAEAFEAHLTTGRVTDSGPVTDTHELREQWFALIRNEIAAHTALATTPEADVMEADLATWQAIQTKGGPIREGYVIAIAQNKFGVHRVGFDQLLNRLRADQLEQLLFTVRNRIASREGRPQSRAGRNSGQRTEAAKARRQAAQDPGEIADRGIPEIP